MITCLPFCQCYVLLWLPLISRFAGVALNESVNIYILLSSENDSVSPWFLVVGTAPFTIQQTASHICRTFLVTWSYINVLDWLALMGDERLLSCSCRFVSSRISLGLVAHGVFVIMLRLGVKIGRLLVTVLWRCQHVVRAGCAPGVISHFCAFRWRSNWMLKRSYAMLFACCSFCVLLAFYLRTTYTTVFWFCTAAHYSCSKMWVWWYALQRLLIWPFSYTRIILCPFCENETEFYTGESALDEHISECHPDTRPKTCHDCGVDFWTLGLLNAHVISAHSSLYIVSVGGTSSCLLTVFSLSDLFW